MGKYKEGSFPGMDYKGKAGNIVKQKKGMGRVKHAAKKMGVGALAAKKPMVKISKGKGNTKVSGKTSALASKSPKKLKASSKGAVPNGKGKIKLADYVF